MNLDKYLQAEVPLRKPMRLAVARDTWRNWRLERGVWSGAYVPLLTAPDHNVKLAKSAVPTYGLSLAPANLSGHNVCNWSTPLCRAGCLNTAGKGTLDRVQRGRMLKTQFLAEHPMAFLTLLEHEIRRAAERHGAILMRLNVLSDLSWEVIAPWLFDIEGVEFYDYTKSYRRAMGSRWGHAWWPKNYRLVYSASERDTQAHIERMLLEGLSVAVVFDRIPTWVGGAPIVNGDLTDDRYHEERGVLVALRAKGKLRRGGFDGFVKRAEDFVPMAYA